MSDNQFAPAREHACCAELMRLLLAEQTLSLREKLPDSHHPDVAISLTNLTRLYK